MLNNITQTVHPRISACFLLPLGMCRLCVRLLKISAIRLLSKITEQHRSLYVAVQDTKITGHKVCGSQVSGS